jgi:alanyl-tRNA synthetase
MGDVSKEICGGNHVSNTRDIEEFMIVSIENKGGGAWRLEGLTSHQTVNKYLSTQIESIQLQINKMCKDIEQSKINSKEFNTLVEETNYEISSKNLLNLRKRLTSITTIYRQLMLTVDKKQSENEVEVIKQLKKHLSASKQIYYFTYNGTNNKVINQALTALANEDHEHAFVIINNAGSKIQYIAIASKDFVNKHSFNSNSLIKNLNELTKGSGGGRDEFAQGGTPELKSLNAIINYIKSV